MSEIIKIKGRPIGIIGMETAFQYVERLAQKDNLSLDDIVDIVMQQLKKRNYIPTSAEPDYKEAIKNLWEKRHKADNSQDSTSKELIIRVLGKDCMTCSKLEQDVLEVLNKLGMAADVMHITDMDEIWRFGVFNTPALVINDKVVCQGRKPTPFQIEEWLKAEW